MQQTEYPLFTVIIPQKNRAEYLVHTLKTCMIQEYPNFEIIVSDDCSEDNSVEVIKDAMKKDSRIKLFAHDHHLGMRDNFEFALNQVRPGYVMALGGDDGLVAGGIWRMYEILKETGKELLAWATAFFTYPASSNDKCRLVLRRGKNYGIQILKSSDYLNKIAKTFYYMIDETPMFYIKGIASTQLVDKVRSRTPDHCFYYCPTPDGFSGVVLAGEVEEYAFTNEPLSIGGNTTKSQGLAYKKTDEISKKEAQQFFNDNIRRTMHEQLASQQYSPLVPLMTADYLLTAKDLPNWPGKFEMFSFDELIRACFRMLVHNPFANDVLVRELKIIECIAKQHDMLPLFNDLLNNTKRKIGKPSVIYSILITPRSIQLEGNTIGINNIYDAALSIKTISKLYRVFSLSTLVDIVKASLCSLINSMKYKVYHLPIIEEV